LQGLQVFAYHVIGAGYYLSEHPAPPQAVERPTVLMRQHPHAALRIINPWEWHAEAVKPTGLLSLRLPKLIRSMRSVPDLATEKPQTSTVGKGPDGRFRTAGVSGQAFPSFCKIFHGLVLGGPPIWPLVTHGRH